ncbi:MULTISPECIES: uracil-DNA glycosylase family protein [Bacillaceae]|uniref:uracil-DNA glycosylase family protein n=1 Tax=Bacillaceae TaxID=186817 RepID=UPI000BFCAB03|nr:MULTISPECIES: uracil-DNA glycosylase family protein [Bacillaceae]PGT82428.1 hypothetical protein COD11_14710 [Bacillus sp. AFS040349]UGB31327.1 hypothetical protein LPC09_01995 [Metabacillus sp. B2-18]
MESKLQSFLPVIQSSNLIKPLKKQDLLTTSFLIDHDRDNELTMYYSPHNEYINHQAKIVIIGITPGWTQMKAAFEQVIDCLPISESSTLEQTLKKAKIAASFSGAMRKNLINMLDHCGIQNVFQIKSSSYLFSKNRDFLHTTSIIKYPVFYQGRNYTGHRPKINHSSLLTSYAYEMFPKELSQIKAPALVIPLGKMVEEVLKNLIKNNKLNDHIYLFNFPHPSGANGHRIKQFTENKQSFISTVLEWATLFS